LNVLIFCACTVVTFIFYVPLGCNVHNNFNNSISLLFRFYFNILVECACWVIKLFTYCCAITDIILVTTILGCACCAVIMFAVYNLLQRSQRRGGCGELCWSQEERDIGAKMFNGMMLCACCEILIFMIYIFLCCNEHHNFNNISLQS
jgi:hypothetical protein